MRRSTLSRPPIDRGVPSLSFCIVLIDDQRAHVELDPAYLPMLPRAAVLRELCQHAASPSFPLASTPLAFPAVPAAWPNQLR